MINTCWVKEIVTESRSSQIERNHSTLQDDFFPPYYSFHETPGDIVHTLLTAFTPLLFLCYPYPSLQHSSPGGNTRKSCICKGCQCWLLDNHWKARGPSPALQLGWFKLLPQGTEPPDPPGSTLIFNTWAPHRSGNMQTAYSPFLFLTTITLTGRVAAPY